MESCVKILDWQARRIKEWMSGDRLMRLSVVFLDLSLLFLLYAPFSGEKQGVYQMSFLALFFAAVIATIESERYQKEEEGGD